MRFIIQAVPSRKQFVDELVAQLSDVQVVYDVANNHAVKTFIDCMKEAKDDAHVHLEDDIVLTSNFEAKINDVISNHQDEVIQFFSMRKADLEVGSRYDSPGKFLMNQCVYLPKNYGKYIIDFYNSWEQECRDPDVLLREFLRSRKEKYWLSVPSLVDHRQTVSAIDKRRSSKRQSLTFVL